MRSPGTAVVVDPMAALPRVAIEGRKMGEAQVRRQALLMSLALPMLTAVLAKCSICLVFISGFARR